MKPPRETVSCTNNLARLPVLAACMARMVEVATILLVPLGTRSGLTVRYDDSDGVL